MAMDGSRSLVQDVLRRHHALKSEYDGNGWKEHHMECSRFIMPRTGRYFVEDANETRRNEALIDNSATRAARVMAAGMASGMSSPHQPWVRLQTPDPRLNEQHNVRLWLDDVTNRMMRVFSRSNFYNSLHQVYEELGVYGTASMIIVPDFDRVIHCHPLTAGQYFIATNSKGEVTTLYREFQMTVSQLVRRFGFDRCSDRVQDLYRSGTLDAWIDIVHAIEPRYDRNYNRRDNRNMPWRSIYFERGEGHDTIRDVLRESGFPQFPCVVPRWALTPGDVYGNGPGMEALGDIVQLQDEQFRKGQAVAYATKPPLQMPTSMKNEEVNTDPGGENYVDPTNPQGGIRPLWEVRLDMNPILEDIRDVRGRIQASFFADLFLMLYQANHLAPQRRTATEIAELHGEKLLMLGPVLERLTNELLSPAIDLTFAYMLNAGLIPPPPEELQGMALVPEFVSVLAQAQRAAGINSIDRFMVGVASTAELWPESLDNVDIDAWVQEMSMRYNIPPTILREQADVELIREQRARAQAAAAQLEAQATAASTAKDAAQAESLRPVDPVAVSGGFQNPTQPGGV